MITFTNCADENTPKGKYATVSETADVRSDVGFWSKVGFGAKVGRNSELGNWTSIGHFADVGNNVEFGHWASVGIAARVQSGSKLGSHEYVPSGHYRKRNGSVVRIESDPNWGRLFRSYDVAMGRTGPRVMTTEMAEAHDAIKKDHLDYVASVIDDFIASRGQRREPRFPAILRLIGIE